MIYFISINTIFPGHPLNFKFQACIITEHERRLRKAAAEMRAFGYPSAATSDVDSFITYLNIIRIQVHVLDKYIRKG